MVSVEAALLAGLVFQAGLLVGLFALRMYVTAPKRKPVARPRKKQVGSRDEEG